MQTTHFPTDAELAKKLLEIVEAYRKAFADAEGRAPSFRTIEVNAGITKGFLTKIQRIADGDGENGFALKTARAVADYVVQQRAQMTPATAS